MISVVSVAERLRGLKFPEASGKEVVEALMRAGFVTYRTRGSPYILKHPETGCRVTVPYHWHELAPKRPCTLF